MRIPSFIFLILLFFFYSNKALCDNHLLQRKEVQEFINTMATTHRLDKQQLSKAMENVRLLPQVIQSMENPGEKKPWNEYRQIFLTPDRVKEGISFWKTNQKALEKAEKLYGVPANIIVAILGVETFYGKKQGDYRVLDALSTLAFNYPKRSPYFLRELQEYFLLCSEHEVNPEQYLGSYAGAMGKPQFMPSSYRHYAAHFSPQKKKDLMNDNNAVIASVANYFNRHGWKPQGTVAKMIKDPTTLKTLRSKNILSYEANKLRLAKNTSVADKKSKPNQVSILELASRNENFEHWLIYPNFHVITRYNSNPQYAMAVYLLSLQLKQGWLASNNLQKKYA